MTGADHQDRPRRPAAVGADRADAGQAGADLAGAGLPLDGLSWCRELDLEALLAAVSDPADRSSADHAPVDVDAEFAEYLEAVEAGRSRVVPLATVAGRVAESVPTGPDLAGWLATGPATDLEDGALAGMAASYRRLASWAQAGELSVVAELASRSAAANDRIGVDEQGRPARLSDDACAEVSLALTMSQASASWWADLGVTLQWRLAATGAALRAGTIDLGRARAIAEATALLNDETARAVEARMLAGAGAKTMAQLRAALRRAVIAADPQGAERRREEAERQAKVVMYPEADGTASLAGYSLPGVRAAAAMARISALAQALKASGAGGGIDLLRAQVFLGLLLGTLPYIPPPADGPPDAEPPADSPSGAGPSVGSPPTDSPPGAEPSDNGGREDDLPDDRRARGRAPAGCPGRDDDQRNDPGQRRDQRNNPDQRRDQRNNPDQRRDQRNNPDQRRDQRNNPDQRRDQHGDRGDLGARPPPAWPDVPPFLQPGPAAMDYLVPATGGLLDLRLPWATLTGQSPEPGYLARLGPITPTQASYLADLAAGDPAARWRVIVTDPDGRAVAVTRLPSTGQKACPQAGLVGQVTVIIGQDRLTEPTEPQNGAGQVPILTQVLAAAQAAAAQAADDAQADGGCAHGVATTAYRPTRKLWEHVTARDLTCRFLTCRQPATRCDLDHTIPFDQGGRTCSCNLGGLCRFHHQIKGHPRWHLDQATPGTFTWTTPSGRTYTTQPDSHAA